MGNDCFCELEAEIQQLAAMLRQCGWMLSTAESCTGGMVSALCTAMPGSSAWFQGGVVSYANEAKVGVLRVDPNLIESHGAVSRPVAEAMARGALEVLDTDISLAITGIAGPTGGTEEKPVGTVWIAVGATRPRLSAISQLFHFKGGRRQVRQEATKAALRLLLEFLSGIRHELPLA